MKLLIAFLLILINCCVQAQTALEIVQKADEKMRGKTSQAEMVIKTIRPTWSREITVKTWMKGSEHAIILLMAPIKDKGIVFLKRKKEVWNWMPSLEKTIKLPPSMMSQSWMGTDFTNDDLVKESSIVLDYNHQIVGDSTINNRLCYTILMIPKPDASIVWGKLLVYIDKMDFLELHTKFYDEDGSLVNTMNAFDIKIMDGRLIPTTFEMIPANKNNQKTIMTYKSIQYNKPIDDVFFTVEKMKSLSN